MADAQSKLPEVRRLISSVRASVTGTLGGSHKAHNYGVVDVEAPGNTGQTFPLNVPSAEDLADLVRGAQLAAKGSVIGIGILRHQRHDFKNSN
jgi:hypothetical protein